MFAHVQEYRYRIRIIMSPDMHANAKEILIWVSGHILVINVISM